MGGYIYDDGGRAAAGFKGTTGDCVTRAIAIATGKPYKEVYDALNELAKRERTGKRKRKISSSRTGVYRSTYGKYLQTLGWEWVPTMKIGQGCRVHLNAAELPSGTILVKVTHHLTTMINGVIHDIYDPPPATVTFFDFHRNSLHFYISIIPHWSVSIQYVFKNISTFAQDNLNIAPSKPQKLSMILYVFLFLIA